MSETAVFNDLLRPIRCIESGKGAYRSGLMSNTLLTLFDTDRYHEHYRTGFWRDDTIYALVRAHAEPTPERVALRRASGNRGRGRVWGRCRQERPLRTVVGDRSHSTHLQAQQERPGP